MNHRRHPGGSNSQPELGTVSPDRPPQLKKWRNCGFPCGLGCEAPSDDDNDGGESDAASETTWVGSDSEGAFPAGRDVGTYDSHSAFDFGTTASVRGGDGFEGREPSSSSARDSIEAMNASAAGSRSTGDRSRATSAHQSVVGIMTPGPGIGLWAEGHQGNRVDRFPLEYHFLRSPLWLSPQYEHCRGDPMYHRVIPDRSVAMHVSEEEMDRCLPGCLQPWSLESGRCRPPGSCWSYW